jgi:choline dehydrogenase
VSSVAAERVFDVAILGGGTAGCVLAARLSERSGRQVCLLEAGPDYGPRGSGGWPREILATYVLPRSHDWADADGTLPAARIVGGCSAHNACFVVRGTASDYQDWGEGWGPEELSRCLDTAERTIQTRRVSEEEVSPWGHIVGDAVAEAGWPLLDDLNAPDAIEGFARVPVNIVDGIRWNAAFAYLDQTRERDNLTVLDRARVDRIELAGATAVAALGARNGEELRVRADCFILTAGAFGTPAILLRSGIGPRRALREVAIDVVRELPVGEGLEDHCGMSIRFVPGEDLERETRKYSGCPGAFPQGGMLKLRSAFAPDGEWDGHSVAFSGWAEDEAGTRLDEVTASLSSYVMKPRSRGIVRLRSADPAALPVVENRFCTDADGHDLAVILDGLGKVRELASTDAIRSAIRGEHETTAEIADDQAWRERARTALSSYWHPTSTCAIGRVVGTDTLIFGFDNLYVADASIMPSVPRANTNLSTLAVAERASELLDR